MDWTKEQWEQAAWNNADRANDYYCKLKAVMKRCSEVDVGFIGCIDHSDVEVAISVFAQSVLKAIEEAGKDGPSDD